jgi:hypothetical protein
MTGGGSPHLPPSGWSRYSSLSLETRERPKLLAELPPELAQLIEDVTVDSKGRLIPKLYSKLQANKELRAMLNLGAKCEPADVMKFSDARSRTALEQAAVWDRVQAEGLDELIKKQERREQERQKTLRLGSTTPASSASSSSDQPDP